MESLPGRSSDSKEALLRAASGDRQYLGELLEQHRPRLSRMVRMRIDHRLRGRIDQSDVIQEAFLEAAERLPEYLRASRMPFYQWLRFLVLQRVALVHRQHLGTRARDAAREAAPDALPGVTSAALAAGLVGKLTSPSAAAARAEEKAKLRAGLDQMEPVDREILALRHFEQLSNSETAGILGLKPTAASNRYIRALEKLRSILTADSPPKAHHER
jgi:RNA polymerase sigma-70 factor (ECF subfamily)